MGKGSRRPYLLAALAVGGVVALGVTVGPPSARGQMIDQTQAPNAAGVGIAKSLDEEIGAGRGDWTTPDSSSFIIARDPFRAIRRGRQLFQRKFTRLQQQGPGVDDGQGDIGTTLAIGAGLADSCASCHARPRGAAGTGGDVVTRPDSRSTPHLFGLGIKEMLADEITGRLRQIRAAAVSAARMSGRPETLQLIAKGIDFGVITASPDGSVNTSAVRGVDPDLRVRPFFAQGGSISMREFIVGALHDEMGLDVADPDLARAAAGLRVVTPAGMVLDGGLDRVQGPPIPNPSFDPDGDVAGAELPTAVVDYMEFYLLNYFPPATYRQTELTRKGERIFKAVGCANCHVADLQIDHDRRVADVETKYDPHRGIINQLFATATPLFHPVDDGSGFPPVKAPNMGTFMVRGIYTDFRRHDLGPNFWERNWDGTWQKEFVTPALWGVGTKVAFGHDGRSINLTEAILRHGGEAQSSRDAFARLEDEKRSAVLAFLSSLVLFPPDDTASNLNPGDPSAPFFPQNGHGSIKLGVLYNDPSDPE